MSMRITQVGQSTIGKYLKHGSNVRVNNMKHDFLVKRELSRLQLPNTSVSRNSSNA